MKKLEQWFRNFMAGRYGPDKLSQAMLWAALALMLISLFLPWPPVKMAMMVLYYGIMGWSLFRMFSRNTYKRYRENRKYLQLLDRLKDRDHRYFDCPRCRQSVRVPKGKGKIAVTCPKCAERFIRKS